MTLIELRIKGYQALVKELGQLDTIRFLQEMGWGSDDYTKECQESLKNLTRAEFLPHPNPPLIKGREPDFLVSPLYKGGLRGVIIRLKSQLTTFKTSFNSK